MRTLDTRKNNTTGRVTGRVLLPGHVRLFSFNKRVRVDFLNLCIYAFTALILSQDNFMHCKFFSVTHEHVILF